MKLSEINAEQNRAGGGLAERCSGAGQGRASSGRRLEGVVERAGQTAGQSMTGRDRGDEMDTKVDKVGQDSDTVREGQ